MSNPAPSPVLRAIERLRHLSAIALWFATLLGRILPGAGKRAEQAAAWRYIDATMTQFADLLERLAAGQVTPEQPRRATSRPQSRPDSARPRSASRAPRIADLAQDIARPRRNHAQFALPRPTQCSPATLIRPAKPLIQKMRSQTRGISHVHIVTFS